MDKREFAAEGGTIRYWVSQAEADVPQLVFLPGLTADYRLFVDQERLFEGKASVLSWDPPSHGESRPFALDWSMDDLARMLRGILVREGFERPVLVGQSMGGYVAQAYLDLYPGEAAGFVSIDSCPLKRSYYTAAELWALKHTRGMFRAIPWGTLRRIVAEGVATSERGRAVMREMIGSFGRDEYIDLAVHGYRVLAEAVEADRRYEIGCPALLICGEKDGAGSAKRYNRAWAEREGLPLEWIKGAGHNSNTDDPKRVNELIERFVAEVV